MSYIDKNLVPGEVILFRTKKHPIVFLVPGIFLLLALFFSMDNQLTLTMNKTFDTVAHVFPFLNGIHRLPVLIFTFGAVVTGIQQWVLYSISDYVVTNKRIVMREGLLERVTSDLRLTTVSSVSVDQSILAQLLNYGNITINGFGGQNDFFMQVNHPAEFQKSVHMQLNK